MMQLSREKKHFLHRKYRVALACLTAVSLIGGCGYHKSYHLERKYGDVLKSFLPDGYEITRTEKEDKVNGKHYYILVHGINLAILIEEHREVVDIAINFMMRPRSLGTIRNILSR